MNKFRYVTDLGCITNLDNVLNELSEHESVLVGTNIGRLIYFSRTYAIVNQNINRARINGYFSNPVLIDKLQLQFAHTYFEMLNDYAQTGHMDKKWKIAAKHRLACIQPASFSLFFAIRAHIQCDAPEALRRLGPIPNYFIDDFINIQKIIATSSKQVVSSYNPNPRLNSLRELARKIVIIPLCSIIFRWRGKAWHKFSGSDECNQLCPAQTTRKLEDVNLDGVIGT